MSTIIDAISNGLNWLWNGIEQTFNAVRWFLREAHRIKGLLVAAAIVAFKLSYDAVINGLNSIISNLDNMQISANVQNTASDFLSFANTVFPVSEMLAMLVALIHLAALCVIVRAIRSFTGRLFI